MSAPFRITRAEWDATHQHFRGVFPDGTRYVMGCDPKTGGSVLVPVAVVDGPARIDPGRPDRHTDGSRHTWSQGGGVCLDCGTLGLD